MNPPLIRCARRSPATLALLALLTTSPALAAPQLPAFVDDVQWQPRAQLQYDHLINSDAPEAQQTDGDFRRARVGVRARYQRDWVFTGSVDLVDEVRVRDLSLDYRGLPVRIKVGRFQEPFGLAEYGSSKDTLFMERPSPASIGPDYGLGAALNYRAPIWAATVGAFVANDSPQLGGDRNEQSLTGRFTVTPSRGRNLVHLGASISQRSSDAPNGVRLSGSAETILVSGLTPRSVRDPVEHDYRLVSAEFAYRRRSLLVQSEWIQANGDGVASGSGWYGEAGYILTGERRRYSTRFGSFDGVDPKRPVSGGGWGAWEVGVRLSDTDFDGGDQGQVVGVALNWYPTGWMRASLNAQRVTLQEPGLPEAEADVIQARVQLAL